MPAVPLSTPADKPIVMTSPNYDLPMALSAEDMLDGSYCGSEWGWMTLCELVEYGFGVDTDSEVWATQNPQEVYRQMKAYWEAHPCMQEGCEQSIVDSCQEHEHEGFDYTLPPAP